ncbi:MAG: PEP/pyruvate-binding domain-containing protein [Desulfobacca sp.]|uniref:PEP/pyruvate-binding domain-containing protein n=1 Tax=Desulfobacca sp. TaxID=2067990 RepID=UPI0040491EB8
MLGQKIRNAKATTVSYLRETWQRLTSGAPAEPAANALGERYAHFQRLLQANNQVLGLMADMEEKLSGEYLFDFEYIRATVEELLQETAALVEALNGLGNQRYEELRVALAKIRAAIMAILANRREIPLAPPILFFEQLAADQVEIAGGKGANLGEMRSRVAVPVPNGFVITSYAYKIFLDYNNLTQHIGELLSSWRMDDLDSLGRVSEELKETIHKAQIPPDLAAALQAAYEQLAAQEGRRPLLAVRSSAIGEDVSFTFAGQYATYLNVPPSELAATYKRIIASLFTARALFYYKNKGFREEEMAMGVVVMPMIAAQASGVLFSRHPEGDPKDAALINAVWGLGKYAVAGTIEPDQYMVAYQPLGQVLEQHIPPKKIMLQCLPTGGVTEVPVPEERQNHPCLQERHLKALMQYAQTLEDHFGKPQDIEWALDENEQLWILQSRLLKIPTRQSSPSRPRLVSSHRILLDQGAVAFRGVSAGPVVLVRRDEDLKDFPQGGVLVARHTSPNFVTVMHQTAAIVTDAGSPTGHMALLAREFRVPTILNTGIATQVLQPGMVVTVDAEYRNVYEGLVPELLSGKETEADELAETPVFRTLKNVLQKIVPLHLLDPKSTTFHPASCQTVHDIVRYAHEYSMREMFQLREQGASGSAVLLKSDLPFKVHLVDLGGGLEGIRQQRIRPEQIRSLPFKAFWKGVAAMRWPQAKPQNVQSISSVFVKTEEQIAQGENPYRDESYVLLSQNYMNFSIYLGYHFSNVEAYVSDQVNDNYLTFHFHGGGSTLERRERRVRLIEAIIDRIDLQHQRHGDIIEARLAKYPAAEMLRRLTIMGKLTSYTKQLDMVLFSEGIVDWYIKDFLREHVERP